MSYILSFENNYYKPSENLRRLFEDQVIHPVERHPRTQPWIDHVINTNHRYHRETILKRGQTNFDKPCRGLTPKNKVLLYCRYYMPMHLFSSYHIFTRYLAPVSDKVVFIDFGCGPLTSGIAFWAAFAGDCDITCISIDKSKTMRNKAKKINDYGYEGTRFFTKGKLMSNCEKLHEDLEGYIVNGDQTQIIFNFSYLLARDTLDTDNLSIENLSNLLNQIVEKYSRHKMFVVYQNPPIPHGHDLQSSYLHENWYFLKTQLSAFHSQIRGLNTDKFYWDSLADGSRQKRDFYFDILSNEASIPFNDPFKLSPIF